jgi:hypothetical protein
VPTITNETPRDSITIAGNTFQVAKPYAEGHTLTPNEAAALNQVFAENIRNNFAKTVKDATEAGTFDLEVFQSKLDEYVEEYEFGVRTGGGGRSGDPVMVEAMSIARDLVRKAIVKQGHKLSDVSAANITAMAKQALDSGKNPQILELARQRVDAAKDIAGIELDSLGSAGASEGEASEEAAPAKGKRGSAADAPVEG